MNGDPVELVVNDRAVRGVAAPFATLADFLRDVLGLKGTHMACGEGVCGACTVLMDGVSVRSCLVLAHQAAGSQVRTIEGFAAVPRLRAVQQALAARFGAQCGYCTPGMLAVIAEYLEDEAVPDHGDAAAIRARLSAVLCRCTGYQPIVEAVQDLARRPAGSLP